MKRFKSSDLKILIRFKICEEIGIRRCIGLKKKKKKNLSPKDLSLFWNKFSIREERDRGTGKIRKIISL